MINEIRQEINLSPNLEKKINWARILFYQSKGKKGALIRLELSNLALVEPHKIIIKDKVFLFLNGKEFFYINSYDNEYTFSELGKQMKNANLSRIKAREL